MTNEKDKIVLKWYHVRRVKLTREYVGGLLAGFGGGMVLTSALVYCDSLHGFWAPIRVLGLAMLAIGASLALHAQDRYVEH
jgi:hypothetical protein